MLPFDLIMTKRFEIGRQLRRANFLLNSAPDGQDVSDCPTREHSRASELEILRNRY